MHAFLDQYRKSLSAIYGDKRVVLEKQYRRYGSLLNKFDELFGRAEYSLFSTPARTELGGNHTDHNSGRVLAGSVNLDSIATASPNSKNQVVIFSEGYEKPFIIDLEQLNVVPEEKGTTNALIRGIAARLQQLGYQIGGFDACLTSDVLPGLRIELFCIDRSADRHYFQLSL